MDMQFLQENWMLVALAVVSGAMLVWNFIGGSSRNELVLMFHLDVCDVLLE